MSQVPDIRDFGSDYRYTILIRTQIHVSLGGTSWPCTLGSGLLAGVDGDPMDDLFSFLQGKTHQELLLHAAVGCGLGDHGREKERGSKLM